MRQEQFIVMSLMLMIVISLATTTLGGMMLLKTSGEFFRYAQFLYGLTLSLAILLFSLRNFKMLYSWAYVFMITLLYTFVTRKSFYFPDLNLLYSFLLIGMFYSGMVFTLQYVFNNPKLKAVRTLLFSVASAVVFMIVFALFMNLSGHPLLGKAMYSADFLTSFILFVIIGIGFSISDMLIIRLSMKLNVRPDLKSPNPHHRNDDQHRDDEEEDDD
jgi:hypothetical protein